MRHPGSGNSHERTGAVQGNVKVAVEHPGKDRISGGHDVGRLGRVDDARDGTGNLGGMDSSAIGTHHLIGVAAGPLPQQVEPPECTREGFGR